MKIKNDNLEKKSKTKKAASAPDHKVIKNKSTIIVNPNLTMKEGVQKALSKKSQENNIPLFILECVYERGINEWRTTSNKTPEQFAFERVNSFISGGYAYEVDNDLSPIMEVVRKKIIDKKQYNFAVSTGQQAYNLGQKYYKMAKQASGTKRKRVFIAVASRYFRKARKLGFQAKNNKPSSLDAKIMGSV